MSKVMKATDFVSKAKDIAKNYKTLYVMGCFGAPLNSANKTRYTQNHSYNKKASRTKMIKNASSDTFGFDCVCLIKGILWGWNGNVNKTYGGAKYTSNGVPDISANTIIKSTYCDDISTDFNNIAVGEIVWQSGHVGIYIGNKQVVECTPAWENKVQITKLSQRSWKKHGKLKYIDYSTQEVKKEETKTTTTTTKTESVKVAPNNAKKFNSKYKSGKSYKTTDDLRLRTGAGTDNSIMCVMPKGTKVMWYGYYTGSWKYVRVANGKYKGYTGFCSGNYLK